MPINPAARRSPWPFHVLILALVWTAWAWLGGADALAAVREHWPVSLTMVFGSFIAGATSEGGGAVAFPVFTKLLDIAPSDARVFSLAIQSVGMTAASALIIYLRVPVDWRAIRLISLFGIPGMVLGAVAVAPLLSAPDVRISFTLLVSSLAVTLWKLNRGWRDVNPVAPLEGRREQVILAVTGLVGGTMSGLVGNGIDIVSFAVMVLLFRVCEKVATPTSVILMAINSLVGFALYGLALDQFTPTIQAWWLAAVPIVVVGAPLGAWVCSLLDRHLIARVLIGLILIEFVTSMILIPLTPVRLAWMAAVALLLGWLNYVMVRQRRYVPGGGP